MASGDLKLFEPAPEVAFPMSAEEYARTVAQALREAGFVADRESLTSDGSVLLQFLSDPQIGVDVYPTGELVVLIRIGAVNHIHELDFRNLDEMVALLRDARAT